MFKGGTALLSFSPQKWRSSICKAVILFLLVFLFIEYACNIVVYKHHINKIVVPGLAWISNLNQKPDHVRLPTVTSSNYVGLHHSIDSVSVNKTFSSKTVRESRSSNYSMSGNTTLKNSTSQLETLKECPLVPPNLGMNFS